MIYELHDDEVHSKPVALSQRMHAEHSCVNCFLQLSPTTSNVCNNTHERNFNGGPGRTRTYDQGIHSALLFPIRVDYLITLNLIWYQVVRARDALACY